MSLSAHLGYQGSLESGDRPFAQVIFCNHFAAMTFDDPIGRITGIFEQMINSLLLSLAIREHKFTAVGLVVIFMCVFSLDIDLHWR
jgi:hypothetical protein